MDKCDFLCLQEHHLFESEFHNFEDLVGGQSSVMYTAKSSMDPSTFHRGRKYGGIAILWKGNLQWTVTPVRTVSKRLAAVIVKMPYSELLIYCVYMPCDDGYRSENLNEYVDILNEISEISAHHKIDNLCITGDLNTDIGRGSPQTTELKNFCTNEKLCLLVNTPASSVD